MDCGVCPGQLSPQSLRRCECAWEGMQPPRPPSPGGFGFRRRDVVVIIGVDASHKSPALSLPSSFPTTNVRGYGGAERRTFAQNASLPLPSHHRPRTQTHRRGSCAACDRMRQLPVSRKPMMCQYLVVFHSTDTCSSSSSCSDAMQCKCESPLCLPPHLVYKICF